MPKQKVDFDQYAADYETKLGDDLKFFEESSYFAEYKIKIVRGELHDKPLNILEYGCGIGRNLTFITKYFPDSKISACDISVKSLEIAGKSNPTVNLFKSEDSELAKHENQFDLIFISCVFHHIEPPLRQDSMNKIRSLLKPGGILYIFEHNTLNPVTRKIVRECPWDEDAILLKPAELKTLFANSNLSFKKLKYTLFFPAFLKFLRPLEKLLTWLPLGGQYYITAQK
ncbi:MAG: class I SAM-dependent methyltransferase [Ignavibacteria bacterium]|nr:class I SAM-dependent methyltransferase [Ignavibacteria bacterium]